MIAVIFELWPARGQGQRYFNLAAGLRDELSAIDGFISVERFESLATPGKFLSLSFWRDEAAVATWRNRTAHRGAQSQGRGGVFAVMMARQAGKNQTSAHIEALLLNAYRRRGGQIVKAAPTFAPQALNSLLRLETVLANAPLPPPVREQGHIVRVGQARAVFYSAAPEANVVGATASILLEGDEAQDIDAAKWDKDFRPMAASTAATTVLWGTAWTAHTLLAQAIRRAARGEPVVSPEMMGKLVAAFQSQGAPEPGPQQPAPEEDAAPQLSPREQEVLREIARGASNKEIARTLDIAETTVKIHVQHILRKLGLSSRVQAAVYASDRQRAE